jgi:hypothetical protein
MRLLLAEKSTQPPTHHINPGSIKYDTQDGLVDPENIVDLPWKVKNESLFELDIFDSNAAENIIKMIESFADIAGGWRGLEIMVNSGYQSNLFMSFVSILKWFIFHS